MAELLCRSNQNLSNQNLPHALGNSKSVLGSWLPSLRLNAYLVSQTVTRWSDGARHEHDAPFLQPRILEVIMAWLYSTFRDEKHIYAKHKLETVADLP